MAKKKPTAKKKAAPKKKHPGGRPRLFKTPAQMQKAIQEYFDDCDNRIIEIHTEEGGTLGVNKPAPYTICGLALALGTTRQTLLNYETVYGGEFFDTLKKAKTKVEQYAENHLYEGKNPTGAIFNLKCNYQWVDKQVVEHEGTVNISFDKEDETL